MPARALQGCLDRLAPADLSLLRRRYCDSSSVGTLAEEAGKTAKALLPPAGPDPGTRLGLRDARGWPVRLPRPEEGFSI